MLGMGGQDNRNGGSACSGIYSILTIFGFKSETAKQGIKYLFVGGVCTVLDFKILYCLTKFFGVN